MPDFNDIVADDMVLPVSVVTRNLSKPDKAERRTVDHDNHNTRVWLSKHIMWAMRNNHSVVVAPAEPE